MGLAAIVDIDGVVAGTADDQILERDVIHLGQLHGLASTSIEDRGMRRVRSSDQQKSIAPARKAG
jgi:hypothetical protein